MTARSIDLTNLLLASAPLRRAPDTAKRAPHFEAAWQEALRGDVEAPLKPSLEAVQHLLRIALALCEASGMNGHELTILYNDRRDASDFATPAELDELLAAAADELLTMMMGQLKKDAA